MTSKFYLKVGLMDRNLQTLEIVEDLITAVKSRIGRGANSSSYSSIDIVHRVKDFLKLISRDNEKKSNEQVEIFDHYDVPRALFSLFNSPVETNKEIGEESIRLFLNPEIGSFCFPRSVQNKFVLIVSKLCLFIRGSPAYGGELYNSCRTTLRSLLESIGFANRALFFGNAEPSYLIQVLYPFVVELSGELTKGLYSIKTSLSSVSTTLFRLSFESHIHEFTTFSLHLRKAIEDHGTLKGLTLPLCLDIFDDKHPCYLEEIEEFYDIFKDLMLRINLCMSRVVTGVALEYNHAWSYYLSVLKELNNISKLYQGAEQLLDSEMQLYRFPLYILVRFSKRSDDHQWLLKYKYVTDDFESKRLLMMMMFPQVKYKEDEKMHKMLIDRSQLLTESFEHIVHTSPQSLRNGLFVEFKNEIATGSGVLREWLFLVCQALFNPENPLFLACPSDRRRFFPNPAKVDPLHLDYFRFCGQVIALALMHKVQVGIAFDRVFFLQLVGEEISLEDVRDADPCLYKSCKKILEMDAAFMDSDVMGLTFVREIEDSGSLKVLELCPEGNTIVVNSKNREEYVHLLIQHYFVKSISKKVAYFARGLGDIFRKRRFHKIFFQSIELKDLDRLLLGSDKAICVGDWKAHTDYDDYKETDDQICWFWKVVEGMSSEQQRELLFFWTSVKYLPVNGFSGLSSRLYIYKTSGSHHRLPSSHTCFYRLALPHYPSFAVMQQHLFLICQEHMGCSFGYL